MRRIAIAVMGTISGLVLLFSYHTSLGPETHAASGGGPGGGNRLGDGATPAGATPSGGAGATGGASPSPSAGAGAGQPAQGGTSGTFVGDEVPTRWGPVKVQIVVQNGRIVQAQAIEYPNENHHDEEINSWALPQLQDATVQANSAQIDSVGGATVTSGGYIASLQSAVDKAHL